MIVDECILSALRQAILGGEMCWRGLYKHVMKGKALCEQFVGGERRCKRLGIVFKLELFTVLWRSRAY